jgi:hypothetical protein
VPSLQLEVERGRQPIEGRLTDEAGSTVAFTGWLELIAALEKTQLQTVPAPGPRLSAEGD